VKYFYDTEFIEDGRTIDLISIGIVADDGREYYAVSDDITRGQLSRRIRQHEWLMANVVPSLPKPAGDWNLHMPKSWLFDYHSPIVKPRNQIAAEVRRFILGPDGSDQLPYVELWADYAAYDHVVLCQLWGRMIDLPEGMPMFTHDIQQAASFAVLSDKNLPQQASGLHNALEDARHCAIRWQAIRDHLEDVL
jgi:hypothetical protein